MNPKEQAKGNIVTHRVRGALRSAKPSCWHRLDLHFPTFCAGPCMVILTLQTGLNLGTMWLQICFMGFRLPSKSRFKSSSSQAGSAPVAGHPGGVLGQALCSGSSKSATEFGRHSFVLLNLSAGFESPTLKLIPSVT